MDADVKEAGSPGAVGPARAIMIACFNNRTDPQGEAGPILWDHLVAYLSRHQERPEKDGPGWSPTLYPGRIVRRGNKQVQAVTCLVLDCDDGTPLERLRLRLAPFEWVAHTTHSHTPAQPKYRVVLPLPEPVPVSEWEKVWSRAVAFFTQRRADPQCKDPSRFYYFPSCRSGSEHWAEHHEGEWLNPRSLPAAAEPEAGRRSACAGRDAELITIVKQAGYYLRQDEEEPGKHYLLCPWRGEHSDPAHDGERDAYLRDGSGERPAMFHCSHAHSQGDHGGRDYSLVDLRGHLAEREVEWLLTQLRATPEVTLVFEPRAVAALAQLSAARLAQVKAGLAQLLGKTFRSRDFDRVVKEARQQAPAGEPPEESGDYTVREGRIVQRRFLGGNLIVEPLSNFDARIVEEVIKDDGAEAVIYYTIAGQTAGGAPLPPLEVPASQYPKMQWPARWGARAVLAAGAAKQEALREAIQALSLGEEPLLSRRTVYSHLGWRDLAGAPAYLSASGALGADGLDTQVLVDPWGKLAAFQLPAPPEGAERVRALQASLRLLDVAPWSVSAPVWCLIWRALLHRCDFSLFLLGDSGFRKTELAALAQRHWGVALDRDHLPGNWESTPNALELLTHAAKDALVVIDDFAPKESQKSKQELQAKAERVFRAQGNHSPRGRLRADLTAQPDRAPRGAILATGETLPTGASLRGRLLTLNVGAATVDIAALGRCQEDATSGLYAQALAGFVQWLAGRHTAYRGWHAQQYGVLRQAALAHGGHPRHAGISADLYFGAGMFFQCAQDLEAVTAPQAESYLASLWTGLMQAQAAQGAYQLDADPVTTFLQVIASGLSTGKVHLGGIAGGCPSGLAVELTALGWHGFAGVGGAAMGHPQGDLIGWITSEPVPDNPYVFLDPQAAFAFVITRLREMSRTLPITQQELYGRLKERGLSIGCTEGKNTTRRTCGGQKARPVVCLPWSVLQGESAALGVAA